MKNIKKVIAPDHTAHFNVRSSEVKHIIAKTKFTG